ncbi:NUDIX domain-containing protein [Paenibacillus sp. NPDC057967]|uniref:NUDIX domain-containing protein n=1 Tax=Paenibacillus sp. NPDC057967 TaxID=3346293 RepID=UPI0036DD40C0
MKADMVYKVTAYLTRIHEGKLQLLVFREQDYEDLGLQVPGGTVEENEPLLDALRREIMEESGIQELNNIILLGEYSYYSETLKQHVHRYYYQLEAAAPEAFTHVVQSNDEDNGWIFHYFWIDMEACPPLYSNLGEHLDKVRQLAR